MYLAGLDLLPAEVAELRELILDYGTERYVEGYDIGRWA